MKTIPFSELNTSTSYYLKAFVLLQTQESCTTQHHGEMVRVVRDEAYLSVAGELVKLGAK